MHFCIKISVLRLLLRKACLHHTFYKDSKYLHLTGIQTSRAIRDPENVGEGQQGINFDTLGSWNNRLELPILVEESIKKGRLIPAITCDQVCYSSLTGRRRENDDRVLISQISKELILCGIFDGHGGGMAAEFLYENFTSHVKFWLQRTTDLKDVLIRSFSDVNNSLARHLYQNSTECDSTGSTATVCLLQTSSRLVVGHVGDSRIILCRKGHALCLTKDHSPDDNDEIERILRHRGFIQRDSFGRPLVNGRLAMTRSIGDLDLKPFGVIATPQTVSVDIKHGHDAFAVLSSDGLNFVLSDQEIVDVIKSCSIPTEAADFITDQALHFGSDDNATSIIIPFGAWGKFRGSSSVLESFGRIFSRSIFD